MPPSDRHAEGPSGLASCGSGGAQPASGVERAPGERVAGFAPAEVAIALSHYDVGVIESIRELPRGSGDSPKVVVKTHGRTLLLKRRGAGKDDERRINLSHALQTHLEARRFPIAPLARTRTGATFVRTGDRAYELFAYVEGDGFDASRGACAEAGGALAQMHRLAADFTPAWAPTGSSFHDKPQVEASLSTLTERLDAAGPAPEERLEVVAERLREAYSHAAARANDAGVHVWPSQVIHGDWHPGNLIFRAGRVAAVLDFDAARIAPRAMDLAGGALQFSLTRAPGDPGSWPSELDADRFAGFCAGYDGQVGCRISVAEVRALPWLMAECLIVEALAPIAATGSFARMDGGAFLRMIDRKVAWIRGHAEELSRLVEEAS
jgi:Ser/Thr protein kinase RdoA (MazF antagonist)